MTAKRQDELKSVARSLQRDLWQERQNIWTHAPDADGVLPIPVDVIVRNLLAVTLEEPEEIPAIYRTPGFDTAGFIDRLGNRIVVAQKHRLEWRRFTIAHEIGHWVLHPNMNYHRDRPLNGGERANESRPQHEQEADVFAAELLMPEKMLNRKFIEAFGSPIDGRQPNHELAFWLSAGTRRQVNEIEFSSDLRYRAMVIAETSSLGSRRFTPLVKTFGVSPTAMAIQLEDLRLVV